MNELDLLKKAWQKDNQSFKQVSESEIYKMLHRNSSSSVKWILIVSVLEFALWACINIFFNADEYLKSMHAEDIMVYLKVLTYINYAVIFWFIYKFYTNYIRISTTTSTKQLMQDILNTRKTVQNYVWYNLGMMFISMILGFILAFVYNPNPQISILKDKIAHEDSNATLIKIVCILGFFTALFLTVFWLFYRLLYGFFLRRLRRNYRELQKIDL